MSVLVVGCNFRNCPVHLRERLTFDDAQTVEALARFRAVAGNTEAVLLSTCNRVEMYLAADVLEASAETVSVFWSRFHDLPEHELAGYLYTWRDAEAVRHLFRVASSLDSMVVGEAQILGQVKTAYERAHTLGTTGPLLNSLFQRARRVARKVHTATTIARRHLSVSTVAVDFARRVFEDFADKTVLVIGAGETSDRTAACLRDLGVGRWIVINRSETSARELADRYRGDVLPWDRLADALTRADMVISSTASPDPLIGVERFRPIMHARQHRPLLVVDIAVPRDFDPRIGDLDNVYLYNIDDLQELCRANLGRRQAEVEQALRLVDRYTDRFVEEVAARQAGPLIARLRERLDRARQEELERLFARVELPEAVRREIAYAFKRMQGRIIHQPLKAIKREARGASSASLVEAIRQMLDRAAPPDPGDPPGEQDGPADTEGSGQ